MNLLFARKLNFSHTHSVITWDVTFMTYKNVITPESGPFSLAVEVSSMSSSSAPNMQRSAGTRPLRPAADEPP